MKAIRKKPGCAPEIIEVENTLQALQDEVGGHIEVVTVASDTAIICYEEGHILGLPYCCQFCGAVFVGSVVMVGVRGDEFCDVSGANFLMEVLRHA